MWRLSIVDDESNRTVVNLVLGLYTIGRAEEAAIRLTERNVSRKHAQLELRNDVWVLSDVGSRSGTFVNDIRVEGELALSHRDRLRIGDYEAVLTDTQLDAAANLSADRDAATLPGTPVSNEALEQEDRIAIVEGVGAGTQFPLRTPTTLIGRGEECDVPLNDTSVSRQHCAIERDEHGRFQVVDKNSSNGVRVNGSPVKRMALYSRDLIELGDVILQFVPQGARFDIQAARQGRLRHPPRRRPFRWAIAALSLLALAAAGGFGLRKLTSDQPLLGGRASSYDPALQRLAEARDFAQAHRWDAVHRALQNIPLGHPARESAEFRELEMSWVDEQLELVERTSDAALQRTLLQNVLQIPELDSQRSAQALARLRGVDERLALDALAAAAETNARVAAAAAAPVRRATTQVLGPARPLEREPQASDPGVSPLPLGARVPSGAAAPSSAVGLPTSSGWTSPTAVAAPWPTQTVNPAAAPASTAASHVPAKVSSPVPTIAPPKTSNTAPNVTNTAAKTANPAPKVEPSAKTEPLPKATSAPTATTSPARGAASMTPSSLAPAAQSSPPRTVAPEPRPVAPPGLP